jgi:hypothetical protein
VKLPSLPHKACQEHAADGPAPFKPHRWGIFRNGGPGDILPDYVLEPVNLVNGPENCAGGNFTQGAAGNAAWSTANCGERFPFLCEIIRELLLGCLGGAAAAALVDVKAVLILSTGISVSAFRCAPGPACLLMIAAADIG